MVYRAVLRGGLARPLNETLWDNERVSAWEMVVSVGESTGTRVRVRREFYLSGLADGWTAIPRFFSSSMTSLAPALP